MKKALVVCGLLASLTSCSLLRRDLEEPTRNARSTEVDDNAPPFDPAESVKSLEESAETAPMVTPNLEGEVSRLNTKIAALETKLDVLSSNLEKVQMQRSQPIIEARSNPEASLSAPVDEKVQTELSTQISAAPSRPAALPSAVKASSSSVEADFQAAMELYRSGEYAESATLFSGVAKASPRHMLASHALYWAGEASFRAQNWPQAIQAWKNVEANYPDSAYFADSLAGLAKANEKMGDASKAASYRNRLAQSFPKSPAFAGLGKSFTSKNSAPAAKQTAEEEIPVYQETPEASE